MNQITDLNKILFDRLNVLNDAELNEEELQREINKTDAFVQMSLYGIPAIVYQSDTLQDPNGLKSTTGKMYTIGYMLAPELWKYEHDPSKKKVELPDPVVKEPESEPEPESEQLSGQMDIFDFITE